MNYGIVEMMIFFAGVLGFAVWQLIAAERLKKRMLEKEKSTAKD
jgi:hypothetical protein